MSSGERDSLNLGFPYLLCYMSVCCNISVMAGQNTMKLSHQGLKALQIPNMMSEQMSQTPKLDNL